MKKLFTVLVALAMVFSLAGCGEKKPETQAYSFKVWCADNIVELTKQQLDAFAKEHTEYQLTFTVEAVGEGDAATSMITDVEAGADIFCFAQDQLARLVQANALAKPGTNAAATIKADNDGGAVGAATLDGTLYAYPLTSDNGFFMYYDKTVIKPEHIGDLGAILEDCVANGKYFSFNGSSAWYNAAFFFATGCVSEWNMNGTDIVSYHDTYNSDAGVIAMKGFHQLTSSPAYNDGSSVSAFESGSAVVISGTWDYEAAVNTLGDNLGAAELPSFTVDGKSYHLGSFGGNKLMGVKPQTDANKAAVASQIALYLTGEKCQMERFNAVAWGPSNKAAASSDAVAANPALAAFAAQNNYAVPQGQFPGSWWDIGGAIGKALQALGQQASDAQIKEILTTYSDSLAALLTVSDDVKNAWTVIGMCNATDGFFFTDYNNESRSNWTDDIPMEEVSEGVWKTVQAWDIPEGCEFKVRQGMSWDNAFPADNFKVEAAGKYYIQLEVATGTVSLVQA